MAITISKYLLESGICLLVFYVFYTLILRRETFFQFNRLFLLIAPVLSLLIPFINVDLSKPQLVEDSVEHSILPMVEQAEWLETYLISGLEQPEPVFALTIGEILFFIYLLGLAWMTFVFIFRMRQISHLIRSSKKNKVGKYTLVKNDKNFPAASFFGYIFWNKDTWKREEKLILKHELVHIRQWHSLDVIVMELLVIFNWFNPLIFLFQKSLQLTHEYIADEYVVKQSDSVSGYAELLVQKSKQLNLSKLVNTFHSFTKMRLLMLNKTRSKFYKKGKILLLFPISFGLMLLFSFNLIDQLPNGVGEGFNQVGEYLERISEVNVYSDKADPRIFQLTWTDKTCNCRAAFYQNFFQCDNLSFTPKEFRRLLKHKKGFALHFEGKPISYRNLQIISTRTLMLDGHRGQFDEQGQFNPDATIWKRVRKGDVLKLVFKAKEKLHFEFNLTINNRRESYDYDYQAVWGDYRMPIEMMNHLASKTMDFAEFQKLVKQKLQLIKNDNTIIPISRLSISNALAMRFHTYVNLDNLSLEDIPAIKEAEPNDEIIFRLHTKWGQEFVLTLKIRKNSSWDGKRRKIQIKWGERIMNILPTYGGTIINIDNNYVSIKQLRELADKKISLLYNNREIELAKIGTVRNLENSSAQYKPAFGCLMQDYGSAGFQCLRDYLLGSKIKTQRGLSIYGKSKEDHLLSCYFVINETGKPKKRKITIIPGNKITPEELKNYNNVEFLKDKKIITILDGKEISQNQLSAIDHKKIEHIEIRNDEAYLSKYGERANNGAIFIELERKDKGGYIVKYPNSLEAFMRQSSGNPIFKRERKFLILLKDKEITQEDLMKIDPDEIERIEIRKDWEFLKSYGKKGENGIVFIHLKKE